jgi:hypothetical protein
MPQRRRADRRLACRYVPMRTALASFRGHFTSRPDEGDGTTVVGVVGPLTAPPANAGTSVFGISTFDTDCLLLKEMDLGTAVNTLRRQGRSAW